MRIVRRLRNKALAPVEKPRQQHANYFGGKAICKTVRSK
jgi:hypothetical protein